MDWPTIMPNFLGQPHQEGFNYSSLLGLGSGLQQNIHHSNQINFDGSHPNHGSSGGVPSHANTHSIQERHNIINHTSNVGAPVSNAGMSSNHHFNRNVSGSMHDVICGPLNRPTSNRINTISSISPPMKPPESQRKLFGCDKCEEEFEAQQMLTEHVRHFHRDLQSYPCHLCDDKFEKRSLLQNHLRRQHHIDSPKQTKVVKLDNGMFGCGLCDETFPRLHRAYAHRLKHYPARHICHICNQAFFSKGNMLKHVEGHKKNTVLKKNLKYGPKVLPEKQFMCPTCNKGFTREKTLEDHILILHQRQYPHYCDTCHKGFWKHYLLAGHCQKVHGFDPPPLARKKPGPRHLKPLSERKTRTRRTTGPDGRKRPPPNASKLAKRQRIAAASRDHRFLCHYCSLEYTNKDSFRLHLVKCLGGKVYPCFLCEDYFDSNDGLSDHLKDDHHNQKPVMNTAKKGENGRYQCQDCGGEGWTIAKDYYSHRLAQHSEKRITCAYCDKGFVLLHLYKGHLQMHTKQRTFKCAFCKVAFAARQYLNVHMANNHFRYMENAYYCKACNKVFAEETFKQHKEEHEGKSPFMCEKCYQGFDKEEVFKKHADSYHVLKKEKKHICEFCNRAYEKKKFLRKHQKACNKPRDTFECKYCSKKYSHFHSLKKHYKICTKNTEKWVPENKEKYKVPVKDVIIPANVKEIEIEEDYACKFCLFPFPDLEALDKHSCNKDKPMISTPTQSYICCLRNKSVPRDYTKEDPLLAIEPPIYIQLISFYCEVCKIPYHSMKLLENHVEKYHESFNEKLKSLLEETTGTNTSLNVNTVAEKITPTQSSKTRPKRKTSSKKRKEYSDESDSEDWDNSSDELKSLNSDLDELDTSENEDEEKSEDDCEALADSKPKKGKSDLKNCKEKEPNSLDKNSKEKPVNKSLTEKLAEARKVQNRYKNSSSHHFVCQICNIKYVLEFYLEKHIRTYHPNYPEGASSISSKADKEGSSKEERTKEEIIRDMEDSKALDGDFSSRATDDDFRYQCKICHLPYKYYTNLLNHIEKNHEEYFLVYPEEKLPEIEETPETEDQAQDSNATDIVSIESESQKAIPEKQIQPREPVEEGYRPPVTMLPRNMTNIPKPQASGTSHHLNQPAGHNSHNSTCSSHHVHHHFNHLPQSRNSCLYQQAPHHVENTNAAPMSNQIQSGYQDCFMQQHQLSSHQMNNNVPSISAHSNYTTPASDTLHFLENHQPRQEHIPAPTNHYGIGNRGEMARQPNQHNIGDRQTYFDNTVNPVPVNDFSYWDRVISQPLNVPNDIATSSYEMSSYNPVDSSFNPPNSHVMPHRNPSFPILPTPTEKPHEQDSDGDDAFDIPDTGFGMNYDDSDSCDDPKNKKKPQEIPETPKTKTPEKEKGKYFDQFVQFSNTKNTPEKESTEKEDESLNQARANAHFCKMCPMYYLREYFLEKHYKSSHPAYWEELEAAKAKEMTINPKELSGDASTAADKDSFVSCQFCPQLYRTNNILLRHYNKVHLDDPGASSVIEELAALVETQKGEKVVKPRKLYTDKKYFCDICDKSFPRPVNLRHHHSSVHLKEKPFSCQFCSQTFVTKNNMLKHEERHVAGDKKFVCETCEKEFRSEKLLHRHRSLAKCCPPEKDSEGNVIVKKPRRQRTKSTRGNRKKPMKRKKVSSDEDDTDEKEKGEVDEDKDDDAFLEEEVEDIAPAPRRNLRTRKSQNFKNYDLSDFEDEIVPSASKSKKKVKTSVVEPVSENIESDREVEVPPKVIKLNKRKMGPKSRINKVTDDSNVYETLGKTDSYFHDKKIVNKVGINLERVDGDSEK